MRADSICWLNGGMEAIAYKFNKKKNKLHNIGQGLDSRRQKNFEYQSRVSKTKQNKTNKKNDSVVYVHVHIKNKIRFEFVFCMLK